MWHKIKMLILKIVFSPMWLLVMLFLVLFALCYIFDKGYSLAFGFEPYTRDWKKDTKDILKQFFEYWRL